MIVVKSMSITQDDLVKLVRKVVNGTSQYGVLKKIFPEELSQHSYLCERLAEIYDQASRRLDESNVMKVVPVRIITAFNTIPIEGEHLTWWYDRLLMIDVKRQSKEEGPGHIMFGGLQD